MIDVGRLRKRVTVVKPNRTRDAYGQESYATATVGTFWAEIRPLSGRELANAAQIKSEVTHAITMRYPGASVPITSNMQILYNGRTFAIDGILNRDERNRVLDITARELQIPNPS